MYLNGCLLCLSFIRAALASFGTLTCDPMVTTYVVPRNEVPVDKQQEAGIIGFNTMAAISQAIGIDVGNLLSVVDYFMNVDRVRINPDSFERFTLAPELGGLYSTTMKGISFVPHVLHNNTDLFYSCIDLNRSESEASGQLYYKSNSLYKKVHMGLRGNDTYMFIEVNNGVPVRVRRRDVFDYYPVEFIFPFKGNEAAAGFDLASNPARLIAIKAAVSSFGRAITGRIQLVQSTYEQYGFLLFYPLYNLKADLTRLTQPSRHPGVDKEQFWPSALVSGAFVAEDLLSKTLLNRGLGSFPSPSQAGSGVITLVFQQLGYTGPNSSWAFLAGFTDMLDRTNTSSIAAFNRAWKAREAGFPIVVNEAFCETITIDDAGSLWMVILGVDYGCQLGERLIKKGFPGENLTQCAKCPSGIDCTGREDQAPSVHPGFWAETDLSVFACFGTPLRCPGGLPGTCMPGRIGIACATCEEGTEPADDGSCTRCKGSEAVVVLIVACIAAMIVIIFGYRFIANEHGASQPHSLMFVATASGTLMNVVQQFSVIGIMTIPWVEPIKSFFQVISVVQFDISIFRLTCFSSFPPTLDFGLKLLVIVAIIAFVFLIHVLSVNFLYKRQFRKQMPALIGTVGTIMMVFLISIVNMAISPFQCREHPNGLFTVRRFQGTFCDWKDEHLTLVSIGIVFIIFPVAFAAQCIWVVAQFPSRVRLQDLLFLQSYHFLFSRFTAESYRFSLFFICRNLLLALAPTFSDPFAQIFTVHLLLLISLLITGMLVPFRVDLANWLDLAATGGMTLFICTVAFFVVDTSLYSLALLCVVGVAAILAAAIVVVAIGFRRYARKPFQYFVCYSKDEAGSFARLLKLCLDEALRSKQGVSLYSDQLVNLDTLLDHVRTQCLNFVVVCSARIFFRPWPVGEIVAAYSSNLITSVLYLPDCGRLPDDFIDNFIEYVHDWRYLLEQNVSIQVLQAALRWLRERRSLDLASHSWQHIPLVDLIAKLLNAEDWSKKQPSMLENITRQLLGTEVVQRVLILVDDANFEAGSSAQCLCKMLMPHITFDFTLAPVIWSGDDEIEVSMERAIIVCTNGAFHQRRFVRKLFVCRAQRAMYLPVVCEPHFRFPTDEYLNELRTFASTSLGCNGIDLITVIKELFVPIAVVFSPATESFVLLQSKVEEICKMFFLKKVGIPRFNCGAVRVHEFDM